MPSGFTTLTERIYHVTEQDQITSPLARQLLHMACHAENIATLVDARRQNGVVLDRWWWSTVAYGWYGGSLAESGISEAVFFEMIDAIWSGQPADIVFLFATPYERDELNRGSVREGYARLVERHGPITVEVPRGTPEETTDFLMSRLGDFGLVE